MRVLGYVADPANRDAAERLSALGAEVFHDMRELPERVAAGGSPVLAGSTTQIRARAEDPARVPREL